MADENEFALPLNDQGDITTRDMLQMLIDQIETSFMGNAEHRVRQIIDIINSDECIQFMESKKEQVMNGMQSLESALERSVYESLCCLQNLIHENCIHHLCDSKSISRLFSAPTMTYLFGDALKVLDDANLTITDQLQKIWRQITTQQEDEDRLMKEMSKFMIGWRKRNSTNPNKDDLEKKILDDFEKGLAYHKRSMEDLLSKIRTDFEPLRDSLTDGQQRMKTGRIKAKLAGAGVGGGAGAGAGALVGVVFGFGAAPVLLPLICAGLAATVVMSVFGFRRGKEYVDVQIKKEVGERFLDRQNADWYPNVEKKIMSFLRMETNKEEMLQFVIKNRLEEDIHHFREYISHWIAELRTSIHNWELPRLNKTATILELKRVWEFAKANLLNDTGEAQTHLDLLNQMIRSSCAGDDSVPVISYGALRNGSRNFTIAFVLRTGANDDVRKNVENFITELASALNIMAGFRNIPGEDGYERTECTLELNGAKVSKVTEHIVQRLSELARIHVKCVLMGDYSISAGPKMTNPAFNRIYGVSVRVSGFIPTNFGFLDYSGEKYFCPSGWRRISLNVGSPEEFHRKYSGWHVAYHGTYHELAATILASGFYPTVGAYSENTTVIYFSPSIKYSGHPRYSRIYKKNGMYMQMIFQVRVNPARIWSKEGGTLEGTFSPDHRDYSKCRDTCIDEHFPDNRNLEWLVKPLPADDDNEHSRLYVIYGIMVRVSDTHPWYDQENAWWKKAPGYNEPYGLDQ